GPNTHPPLPRQAVPPFPQQIDLASTQTPLRRRLLIPTRNLAIQREISSKQSFSAQLACKPHTVQLQRLRMVYCLDAWGFHESVNIQAFKVLEKLRGSDAS
ncbi:unnamed protein product, partial [Brassica oleracea]